jgi:4-hydroxybenzoate polyprenyltransferase
MSHFRAYARLLRLPNVFTAIADICLGALASRALFPDSGQGLASWLLLAASSACLYSGGMVWNDFFDLEQDRRERPFRPLPSGEVSRPAAVRLGVILLLTGWLFAVLAGWRPDKWNATSASVAGVLVAAILLYDRWLKRTWMGPLGMGACRFLNVMLGLSLAGNLGGVAGVQLALVIGVYIVGVTWFARTEAQLSGKTALTGAALTMLAGLVLAVPLPTHVSPEIRSSLFLYLLVGLGFLIGLPVCRAIAQPTPVHVQAAVKRAIMGLVALDASLATIYAGLAGLAILLLLIPALCLGSWIYST